MGWIGKLFSGDEKVDKPATATREEAPAGVAEATTSAQVDAVFYRWLGEATPQHAPAAVEAQILAEITRIAQTPGTGAALVPRVPAIIPQLMRTLRDDDMNAAELSRQLAQDVLLLAEVFREANRPCYRPRYASGPPVKTVEGAIMLLGQQGMRMLLTRVAFRPVISMQTGRLAKRTAPLIWRQSEKSALAGNLLAPAMRANAFDAFLAGLMANVGLVVAFRLIDQVHTDEALPQSDAFIAELFVQARILSAQIAGLWEFPASVTDAIAQAGLADASPQAQALDLGDRLSKLRMLVDGHQFSADDPFVVDGLSKSALACFEKLNDEDE